MSHLRPSRSRNGSPRGIEAGGVIAPNRIEARRQPQQPLQIANFSDLAGVPERAGMMPSPTVTNSGMDETETTDPMDVCNAVDSAALACEGDSTGTWVTRTLRLKVKKNSYAWLNAAAAEDNQVWNWAAEISTKAARPCTGNAKWLTGFDLDKLSSGASKYFHKIGADTIQRVNGEYALKRKAAGRLRLRWRASAGSRRALGWVPFKAESLKRKGRAVRFCGKQIRVFEWKRLEGVKWKQGCFAQDAVGDWWLCLPHALRIEESVAPLEKVGVDLGLKDVAATSDGMRCEKGLFFRGIEKKIAQAQRRGHKRQAKRLHRTASNRRRAALHRFSRRIVENYQKIVVGDVSSTQLVKTRMAKSVLDSGWAMLKTMLQSKGQQAGRIVQIASERYTSSSCSSCGSLSGPHGVNGLRVSHHGTTGSRLRSAVDYAVGRERTVAQSHIRMGAGDEEITIYRFGCPCRNDCSGDSGTRGRSAQPGHDPQSAGVGPPAHRQAG
jgi:putative transposase